MTLHGVLAPLERRLMRLVGETDATGRSSGSRSRRPSGKRLDDRRAGLVPEGRQQQQRRADHQRRQRDVELDRAKLPEQLAACANST